LGPGGSTILRFGEKNRIIRLRGGEFKGKLPEEGYDFEDGKQETGGGNAINGHPDNAGDERAEGGTDMIGRFYGRCHFAFVVSAVLRCAVQ
jgi:hypothetical protein